MKYTLIIIGILSFNLAQASDSSRFNGRYKLIKQQVTAGDLNCPKSISISNDKTKVMVRGKGLHDVSKGVFIAPEWLAEDDHTVLTLEDSNSRNGNCDPSHPIKCWWDGEMDQTKNVISYVDPDYIMLSGYYRSQGVRVVSEMYIMRLSKNEIIYRLNYKSNDYNYRMYDSAKVSCNYRKI